MRMMLAMLTVILGTLIAGAPVAQAQAQVDIPAVIEIVSGSKPDVLEAALYTPMADDSLPSQFSDAILVDPTETAGETAGLDSDNIDGSVGTVTYGFIYEPAGPASPSNEATPRSGGPERIYNVASVHYLIFDHDLDAASLENFDDTLRLAIGDQAVDSDVEQITIQDSAAYLISIETETNGIPLVMEWIAIPVGPVAVVAMTMTGGESVDIGTLRDDAEALALASVAHLGSSVENRKAPAG